MTLRARLGLGLVAMAIVLLIPLLLALRSLEELHTTTRLLRDREFAASLLLSSLTGTTDDIRRAEDALLFVHDSPSETRMKRELDKVVLMTDSLDSYKLGFSADKIRAATQEIRAATAEEYDAASSGKAIVAEMISTQKTRPAVAAIDSSLASIGVTLRNSTRQRVAEAADATTGAERLAAGSFFIVALLAVGIGVLLMRAIGRPVYELERGMKAVAEGDLSYKMNLSPTRNDEFGRLAASYQSMADQLAELNRLRAEFISVASHELKTPINVIIGYLELLQENIYGELTPEQQEITGTVIKQANTLTRLIKRLLDISRFEAKGGKLDPREIVLRRYLTNLEASFRVLAMQRDISFDVQHSETLPEKVYWDEDRVNEVLGNLLSNAFKFTPRGGHVALDVTCCDNEVCIILRDTGAGIAPEQLPHVFDKFFQADNQEKAAVKGSGLGLAIAREIVEAHGGKIKVESELNKGTTFTVTLPERIAGIRRRDDVLTPRTAETPIP
jgi:signal transduction histidine kinase